MEKTWSDESRGKKVQRLIPRDLVVHKQSWDVLYDKKVARPSEGERSIFSLFLLFQQF